MEIVLPRIQPLPNPLAALVKLNENVVSRLQYRILEREMEQLRFLKVLEECDALPFEPAAVETYRKQVKKTARKAQPWRERSVFLVPTIKWFWTDLNSYLGPVPIQVLEKALHIQDKCSNVNFIVDYLATNERTPEDLDPFLIAYVGPKHSGITRFHHIAVWDEPGFGV